MSGPLEAAGSKLKQMFWQRIAINKLSHFLWPVKLCYLLFSLGFIVTRSDTRNIRAGINSRKIFFFFIHVTVSRVRTTSSILKACRYIFNARTNYKHTHMHAQSSINLFICSSMTRQKSNCEWEFITVNVRIFKFLCSYLVIVSSRGTIRSSDV